MQIKTTRKYHFIPATLAIIKKIKDNNCWQWGVEKMEYLLTVGAVIN